MVSFALESTDNVSKPSGAHQSNCCICFKTQDICMKSQSAVIVVEYAFCNYISIEQACVVVIRCRIHYPLKAASSALYMSHRFLQLWHDLGVESTHTLPRAIYRFFICLCVSVRVCLHFREREQESESSCAWFYGSNRVQVLLRFPAWIHSCATL